MFGSEFFGFSLWWIFPLLMVLFCVLMMRGRMGCMAGGHDSRGAESRGVESADSAMDILDKRYALGEMNGEEYEEKKRVLSRQ